MRIRTKKDRRDRIRLRQRKRIHGTAERPRLAVFRSVAHIYAQAGDYAIVVKVIDILGNDTTKTVKVRLD